MPRTLTYVVVLSIVFSMMGLTSAVSSGCTIVGTPGDDILRGTPARDIVCGLGGDDEIIGRGADDVLKGGDGVDLLRGGGGEDLLKGGPGDDTLIGGIGEDVLNGGLGLDDCGVDILDIQIGCEDVIAPVLLGFDIVPAAIDTSQGPQTITIKAHIFDDLSGVNGGFGDPMYSYSTVWFSGPEGTNNEFQVQFRPDSDDPERNLVSGTPQNGHYEVTATLPRYAPEGRWTVRYISLEDEASNHRNIWLNKLADLGLSTGFDQTGPGDSTPPVVSGVTVSTTSVDTSQGPAQVALSAEVSDDVSGIERVSLLFMSPTRAQHHYVFLQPDVASSSWVGTLELPRFSEQGTWVLEEINTRDVAQNYGWLSLAQMQERGWQTTLDQTGAGDTQVPSLLAFDFTPKEIDTRQQDQQITFTIRLGDAAAGISEGTVQFQAPGTTCTQTLCTEGRQAIRARFTTNELVSGDATDGVYVATVTVPRYSELGEWTMSWVQILDKVGNELFLIEDNDYGETFMEGRQGEVSARGFPVSFQNGL